jgi:hypothetical protein
LRCSNSKLEEAMVEKSTQILTLGCKEPSQEEVSPVTKLVAEESFFGWRVCQQKSNY